LKNPNERKFIIKLKPGRKIIISVGLLILLLCCKISVWCQPNAKVLPYQDKNQAVEIQVDVKNAGKVKGDEIVQLYLRDEYASVSSPLKELKGFQRITIAAGETKTVKLTLTPDELMMLNKEMIWVVEPGAFTVMIGASCEDIRLTSTFEVIK
jgi:beta-glucosidase